MNTIEKLKVHSKKYKKVYQLFSCFCRVFPGMNKYHCLMTLPQRSNNLWKDTVMHIICVFQYSNYRKECSCESRNLLVTYLIQQFIPSCKVLLTDTDILLCQRHRTVARVKKEESCIWIHSQKLCNLRV